MASIDLSRIIKEAVSEMVNQSTDEYGNKIQTLYNQIISTRDELAMYHNAIEDDAVEGGSENRNAYASSAQKIAEKIQYKEDDKGQKIRNLVFELNYNRHYSKAGVAREQAEDNYLQAMKRGYYLLNSIGEQVRGGDKITYSLVIRNQQETEAIRWDGLTIEDIIGEYDINTGRFSSNSLVTIYRHTNKTIWSRGELGRLGNTLRIKDNLWSLANRERKKAATDKTRRGTTTTSDGKGGNLITLLKRLDLYVGNKGNSGESAVDLMERKVNLKDSKNLVRAKARARSNNKEFWKGPDVAQNNQYIQVKANGASVTTVSQLIIRLDEVAQILQNAQEKFKQLNEKQAEPACNKQIDTDKILDKEVQKLMQSMFT